MASAQITCSHASLVADVSSHGLQVGFNRIDWKRRTAATTPSGRITKNITCGPEDEPQSFAFAYPAPLVLPEDDLAYDTSYLPQSFRSWNNLKYRNRVTSERKTVYVAKTPDVSENLSGMGEGPGPTGSKTGTVQPSVDHPSFDDVLAYLRAFYFGLEVKEYTPTLTFVPWYSDRSNKFPSSSSSSSSSSPSFIGLKEGPTDLCTRVQTRPSPDGLFSHQLSLNNLLDSAISILPDDAYALLLVVDYDLYEDEDDDFCCGRAYGGSRVAVVSSARYNPLLYEHAGIDLRHMWPASHCASYVDSQCGLPKKKRRKTLPKRQDDMSDSSLHKAVAAFSAALPTSFARPDVMHGLWSFCLARTASHELGHCFGMDHCVYYACAMQSTANVAEDLRQPPYLCPVCAKKLARAVEEGSNKGFREKQYSHEAVAAMMALCARWKHVGVWAAYEAWLGTFISDDESS